MKKFLMIMALLLVLFSTNNNVKAKELSDPVPFDIICDNARFTYETKLNCTFRFIYADYYLSELNTVPLTLVEVDINGNYIRTIDEFNVDFYRETETYLENEYVLSLGVGDGDTTQVVNLRDQTIHEVDSINYVFNATQNAFLVRGVEWDYAENVQTVVIFSSYINDNDNVRISYNYYQNSDFIYEYENPLYLSIAFTDFLEYNYKDGMIYQIRYGDNPIYSGIWYNTPTYNPTKEVSEDYYIEFANNIYTTTQFIEGYEQEYDISKDYIYLRYKFKEDVTETLYVKFYDIATGTIADQLTSDDIYTYQGSNANNARLAYVPLYFNNELNGVYCNSDECKVNNAPNALKNLNLDENGVYLVVLEDSGGSILDYADYLLVFKDGEASYIDQFSIDLLYDEVSIGGKQQVTFNLNNSPYAEYFTTVNARDLSVNVDYSTYINNNDYIFNTSYKTSSLLVDGDTVTVLWTLRPTNLPHSIDPTLFEFTITNTYTIVDDSGPDRDIKIALDFYGIDNSNDVFIVVIIVMLVLDVFLVLSFKLNNPIVVVIANAFSLLIFGFFTSIPNWFYIGILLLSVLAYIISRNNKEVV